MKKMFQHLLKLRLFVMPATVLMFCSWENPGMYNYSNKIIPVLNQSDTLPAEKQGNAEKMIKDLDGNLADLNEQSKEIKIDVDKEIAAALSAVNFEAMQKQLAASLKQIDLSKMQQNISLSVNKAQEALAKVDLTDIQNQMKVLQENLNSEAFKSQFNADKLQKQVNEAMRHAKESMGKAQQQLQQTKSFIDALENDGLIEKTKGYKIEWKEGDLYINGQKQTKEISDKYRKYENTGKIKMLPEGAEHF